MQTGTPTTQIAGLNVEICTRGDGRPLLFLHPGIGIEPDAPCSKSSRRRPA